MTQDNDLCDIGFIGLGVMGKNLVLNLADNGYSVAAFDLDNEKVNSVIAQDKLENGENLPIKDVMKTFESYRSKDPIIYNKETTNEITEEFDSSNNLPLKRKCYYPFYQTLSMTFCYHAHRAKFLVKRRYICGIHQGKGADNRPRRAGKHVGWYICSHCTFDRPVIFCLFHPLCR